jgi:hypothetical protein
MDVLRPVKIVKTFSKGSQLDSDIPILTYTASARVSRDIDKCHPNMAK